MANQYRFSRGVLPALTLALLLAACGGDKPEALLASARDYLAKDDAKAAVIQIKNALQKAPESGEARLLLGQALLKSGEPVGAEVELRKAMDAGYAPDQVVPQLAQALLAIGQPKKVLSDLQTAPLTTAGCSTVRVGAAPKARLSIASAIRRARRSPLTSSGTTRLAVSRSRAHQPWLPAPTPRTRWAFASTCASFSSSGMNRSAAYSVNPIR